MKALVYTGPDQMEIRDVPEPVASDGQCIVDVAYCGICGSDMHAYHGHDSRRVPPLVLGHEAVGVVQTGQYSGKRVAINPLMTCGLCDACMSGRMHLCSNREPIGMRMPGAFAERVLIREQNLIVLPDKLSFKHAVLAEPMACAVHAVAIGFSRLARPREETKVVILGGGAIGLLSALVFREKGIGRLLIAETNEKRRHVLEQSVDAETYNPLKDNPDTAGADIILDSVGSGATRYTASQLVAPGGTIVHIGLQDNEPGLDTRRLTLQEIAFFGAYCYTNEDFLEALSLLHGGLADKGEWTEMRSLSDGAQAFRDIQNGNALPKIYLTI